MTEEEQKTENNETTENVNTVNEEGVAQTEEKSDKNQSFWLKKLNPFIGYGVFFGALVIAVGVGLLVCLL